MSDDIKVSISCITYNQREYIAEAIESFLMQKTNFKYEILIHDDASTDGTTEIIKEYEKKYPDIIKPIYQTENQYSQGVKINENFLYPKYKGKYVALCEGDDYWTDPDKLQKQYDYMEANPDCSMCFHAADTVKSDTGQLLKRATFGNVHKKFYMEDAIRGLGRAAVTNSFFYRRESGIKKVEFRTIAPCGDYPMPIVCALDGYIGYLPYNMSAHRAMANNSLSVAWVKNPEKKFKYNERYTKMLEAIDEYTDKKYTSVVEEEHTRLWATYYFQIRDKKMLKKEPYKSYFKSKSISERVKNNLLLNFPVLVALMRKLKHSVMKIGYKLRKKN